MPSIIFVIYSGHKAREKSKLESEAKKRQKERAQRTTGLFIINHSKKYFCFLGDIRGASTGGGGFAPSNASIQGDISKAKGCITEGITVATQTNFNIDSEPSSCIKEKPKKDSKCVDGRQSSASNRER